ncbi:MAG: ATP-binding protein [Eubacteriaceae bacterium]|jgi:signal transduction histidine kinase
MTVKKRLFISNMLMLLVPIVVTVLIALMCLGFIWYSVTNGTGLSFEDSGDFMQVSQEASAVIEKALQADTEETRLSRLDAVSGFLDKSAMTLIIDENGAPWYGNGDEKDDDNTLIQAADALGGTSTVSNGYRSLYSKSVVSGDNVYQIRLFSSAGDLSYHTLKIVLILVACILGLTILLAVWLTNRFLTRFMVQKIEEPLDILGNAVTQIRDGNLSYRIDYQEEDEFKPVCEAFNDMASRLEESIEQTHKSEETRKELTAGISHDLRSPLTSIRAYTEGLIDGIADTPEKQQKYLRIIKNKTEEIDRMVSQLFLFSKLEMEAFPVHLEPLELDCEIEQFLKQSRTEYEQKGLEISFHGHPCTILADREQLRRIFTNIADNSLKYKTAENGHLDMIIEPEVNGQTTLIFSDDGPGVPEEALPRLFNAFYRTDPARRNPGSGSGLGLAILARIIESMNGTIKAENGKDGGLRIIISLPSGRDNPQDSDQGEK